MTQTNLSLARTAMLAASLVAGFVGLGAEARAAPESYTFDKKHTELRFSWNHLGLSRQSGRFLDVDGSLEFDPQHPEASHVEAVIKLPSLMTGVKELDGILKSKEFFDTASNPIATFRSTEVVRSGERSARVTGDLTIGGITKPAVLDVVWNFSGEHPLSAINPIYAGQYYSGFSVRTQIRRSDWGITRTIPYVSDEIRIGIEAELKRTSAPVAPVEQAPVDQVPMQPAPAPAPGQPSSGQPGSAGQAPGDGPGGASEGPGAGAAPPSQY